MLSPLGRSLRGRRRRRHGRYRQRGKSGRNSAPMGCAVRRKVGGGDARVWSGDEGVGGADEAVWSVDVEPAA